MQLINIGTLEDYSERLGSLEYRYTFDERNYVILEDISTELKYFLDYDHSIKVKDLEYRSSDSSYFRTKTFYFSKEVDTYIHKINYSIDWNINFSFSELAFDYDHFCDDMDLIILNIIISN
jgi:hypothetical protein